MSFRESPRTIPVAAGSSLLGLMPQEGPSRGLRPDIRLLGTQEGRAWGDDDLSTYRDLLADWGFLTLLRLGACSGI